MLTGKEKYKQVLFNPLCNQISVITYKRLFRYRIALTQLELLLTSLLLFIVETDQLLARLQPIQGTGRPS